jgi:hypothetical protein
VGGMLQHANRIDDFIHRLSIGAVVPGLTLANLPPRLAALTLTVARNAAGWGDLPLWIAREWFRVWCIGKSEYRWIDGRACERVGDAWIPLGWLADTSNDDADVRALEWVNPLDGRTGATILGLALVDARAAEVARALSSSVSEGDGARGRAWDQALTWCHARPVARYA